MLTSLQLEYDPPWPQDSQPQPSPTTPGSPSYEVQHGSKVLGEQEECREEVHPTTLLRSVTGRWGVPRERCGCVVAVTAAVMQGGGAVQRGAPPAVAAGPPGTRDPAPGARLDLGL